MGSNVKKHLYDALQAINEIEGFVENLDLSGFTQNRLAQAGVEREFEIIGEALNRLRRDDEELIEEISDYDKIIGFRNILAHGYDIIEEEIVWNAIKNNLPKLKTDLKNLYDR